MFALFFRHKYFMFVILTLFFCSILCQILLGVIYRRLIRETENMSATKNKSLQQLKLKFTSCRQLHESIPNVSVFVDKFLNQISLGKIPVAFLRHLSGQLTLLSVLVAGIGACISIIQEENFLTIAPFYLVSFLGLYLYFAATSLIDLPSKIGMLRTNLVDYLENHLSNRLEQTRLDMRMVGMEDTAQDGKKSTAAQDKPADGNKDFEKEPLFEEGAKHKKSSPAFTPSEAEELELLLREFLA